MFAAKRRQDAAADDAGDELRHLLKRRRELMGQANVTPSVQLGDLLRTALPPSHAPGGGGGGGRRSISDTAATSRVTEQISLSSGRSVDARRSRELARAHRLAGRTIFPYTPPASVATRDGSPLQPAVGITFNTCYAGRYFDSFVVLLVRAAGASAAAGAGNEEQRREGALAVHRHTLPSFMQATLEAAESTLARTADVELFADALFDALNAYVARREGLRALESKFSAAPVGFKVRRCTEAHASYLFSFAPPKSPAAAVLLADASEEGGGGGGNQHEVCVKLGFSSLDAVVASSASVTLRRAVAGELSVPEPSRRLLAIEALFTSRTPGTAFHECLRNVSLFTDI
jgi:hypothetical protein